MVSPRCPVAGSMRVRLSPRSLNTHRVFRSHDGVTCCGCRPTEKWSIILNVFGSITSTLFDPLFGTYTRSGNERTTSANLPAAVSEYTFSVSSTGGMPGSRALPLVGASSSLAVVVHADPTRKESKQAYAQQRESIPVSLPCSDNLMSACRFCRGSRTLTG